MGNETAMTALEANEEGNQAQSEASVTDTIPSSLPPPYEEASDQGMLGSFKHVSIPPVVPAEDGTAVDIRVDEEATSPTQVDPPTSHNPTFVTPFRACRDFIPLADHASCQIVAFAALSTEQSQRFTKRANSVSSDSESTPSMTLMTPATSVPTLPALTAQDMMAALPHRNAIYISQSMQWCVLLDETFVRNDGKVVDLAPLSSEIDDTFPIPLWRREGELQIPVEEQKQRICVLTLDSDGLDSKSSYLETFTRWRSTKGQTLLVNKDGSLSSVVPVALMEQFRKDRLDNPRPGQTGESQFKDAASTLIKVIGNAANGETRALTVTGKTMTAKLGMDDITRRIFGLLGFCSDGKPDANGKYSMIKPPDMTLASWQLKMRRAWLEIALWYQYRRADSMAHPSLAPELLERIPLVPQTKGASDYLANTFAFNGHTQVDDKRGLATSQVSEAFALLGADSNAVESLVEHCYVVNTAGLRLSGKLPFYAALQTVSQSFPASETDQVLTRLGIEKSHGLFSESDLTQAFAKIGVVDADSLQHARAPSNDDFIVMVYRSTVGNAAANKEEVQAIKDALAIVSASRGSPKMLEDEILTPVELDIDKAYSILEVNHDTDDDFISSVFAVALADGSKSAMECTEALRVIAEKRKSQTLQKVYANTNGERDEWEVVDLEKPIGLNNIGNTCYLNSVLQYFFAIRQLREQVLLASRGGEGGGKESAKVTSVRVGGRQVLNREIERSHRFVDQLAQLFSNMITSPASAVTPERELAYLALVSSRVEEINDGAEVTAEAGSDAAENVASMQISNPGAGTDSVVEEPANMVLTAEGEDSGKGEPLQASTVEGEKSAKEELLEDEDGIRTPPRPSTQAPPLPPRPVEGGGNEINEAGQRRNSLMQLGAQQDVSECLDNVMFQVEVAFTAKDQDGSVGQGLRRKEEVVENDDGWVEDGDLLRRLFLGRTLQRLELAAQEEGPKGRGPSTHMKREVFTILPIDVVEEGRDIYDGLDGFFDEEILAGSGGEPIRRTVTLTDAPAIMQIQLQRVQFDRVRGAYKSQAHLEVDQTIFMDRYLDFDPLDPEDATRLEKRRVGREARRRIAELRARVGALEPEKVAVSKSLQQTADFLSSLAKVKEVQGLEEEGNDSQTTMATLSDEGFASYLSEEGNRVAEEVRLAELEIAKVKAGVEELWKDERRVGYSLASVFMHRGEASHGHYFLNQRRWTAEEGRGEGEEESMVWYKYNDQTVSEVNWNEVHRDQSGATPYLLCWVRRDKMDQFDTLCRNLEAQAPQPSPPWPPPTVDEQHQDVTMTDVDSSS